MRLYSEHRNVPVKMMSDITSKTRNSTTNASSMEKMKKLLSPGPRKKALVCKTFGVPLEELVSRNSQGGKVPYIVTRICEHIHSKGFDHEGLFRVNGSTRVVEKLRASFDHRGDADLEEEEDIMAVAGLLKLFLRELPGSLIPEHKTKQFVNVQEDYREDNSSCIFYLHNEIQDLPEEHYNLLKYIIGYLTVIAHFDKVNKMSPMALAIVFGPNLFRCGQGIVGLKDQGTINQIVFKFITNYDSLFRKENEESPIDQWIKKKQKAPPRPPPPKFHVEDYNDKHVHKAKYKGKNYQYDSSNYQEKDDWENSEESSSNTIGKGSTHSPRFSDDEIAGRASPFVLDSDGGYSIIESPVPSARTSECVEKAIAQTITEQLFGDDLSVLGSVDFNAEQVNGIGLDIRMTDEDTIDVHEEEDADESKENDENALAIKDRIKHFENHESKIKEKPTVASRPSKEKPTSKAFDVFERKGLIITQAPQYIGKEQDHSEENGNQDENITESSGDEFASVKRESRTLSSLQFKKPSGPRNRRSPSRKYRNSLEEEEIVKGLEDSQQERHDSLVNSIESISLTNHQNPSKDEDVLSGYSKPRVAFLELTNHTTENQKSPESSPNNGRKPFIPPLDLSTLHEHIDSTDPIPANKGQSVSYQRAKSQLNNDESTDAVISPRNTKLIKRKSHITIHLRGDEVDFYEGLEAQLSPSACHTGNFSSINSNTDIPPSPPVDQEQYRKHSSGNMDDEITLKLKQQTKKVQVLKKKLKHFEETFERENGYKPSQADKSSKQSVKKWMNDLAKAKKEIKKLKEEAEIGSRSRHGSGTSSSGERLDPPDLPPTMEATLNLILKRLEEKRRDARRPEDISLMDREQIQDEKLAVQKALLHFENIHGRPKTRDEKDLMRPLYDRYRTIKRLISKPVSPREKTELQTVPEDQPFELDGLQGFTSKFRNPVQVPTGDIENGDEGSDRLGSGGTLEFAVTRDFSVLRDTVRPLSKEVKRSGHSPKVKRKLELHDFEEEQDDDGDESQEANLHEMSIAELKDELIKSKGEKKRLRRTLKLFEDDFFQKNGRRVQREDREPLSAEYTNYKQVKAKLKLLEALLSKVQTSGDI